MLQQLRSRYVMKKILWGIMILTIPSFVLFYGFSGRGSNGGGQMNVGALVTVNGPRGKRELGSDEITEARKQLVGQYSQLFQQMTGQQVNSQVQNALENGVSRREIANFAVSTVALDDLAKEAGIAVSTDQVGRILSEQGLTQEQLQQYLAARRISQAAFIYEQQQAVRAARSQDVIGSAARVSLLEIWNQYVMEKEKLALDCAYVDAGPLRDGIQATDEELKAYYEAHKDKLVKPAERVYRYIMVQPPAIDFNSPITDEELEARYNAIDLEKKPQYAAEAGIQVRHVQLDAATTESLNAATAVAKALAERIGNGELMSVVADEASDDPANFFGEGESAARLGGLIPEKIKVEDKDKWVGEYGQEWWDAINTMEVGELSLDVTSPEKNRAYVIRVESKSDGKGKKPMQEIKSALQSEIHIERFQSQRDEQTRIADDNEMKVKEVTAVETTLEGIARQLSVDVRTTSPTLASATFIPMVGNFANSIEALNDMRTGELSPVLRSNDNIVVLELQDESPERAKSYEEALDEVKGEVIGARAAELAKSKAEALMARVKAGEALTSASVALDVKYESLANPVSRDEAPEALRSAPRFRPISLRAKEGETYLVEMGSLEKPTGYVVFTLKGREEPLKADFVRDLSDFERVMLPMKSRTFVEEFRRDALKTLEAEISPMYVSPEEG